MKPEPQPSSRQDAPLWRGAFGLLPLYFSLFLSAVDNEAFTLDRQEGLLAGVTNGGTKDQLGVELPALRKLPLGRNLLVDKGAVVLEVAT